MIPGGIVTLGMYYSEQNTCSKILIRFMWGKRLRGGGAWLPFREFLLLKMVLDL